MSSALNSLFGTTQGRIQPVHEAPILDDYVFCFGSDVAGVFGTFRHNDGLLLEQTSDVTGLFFVRFRARIRPPTLMPTTAFNDAVAASGGLIAPYTATTAKWQFTWGINATVHGTRNLTPGRTLDLQDGAIDVSQLTGNQTMRFRLKLVT